MHPSQFPGTHRPAEFSCIWVDGLGGEWVVESNSVSDDVGHFVDWIADCLVMGDRIACIVHLMF
jgi:hypothetical protein